MVDYSIFYGKMHLAKVTRIHTGPGSNTLIGYSPQLHCVTRMKRQCYLRLFLLSSRSGC